MLDFFYHVTSSCKGPSVLKTLLEFNKLYLFTFKGLSPKQNHCKYHKTLRSSRPPTQPHPTPLSVPPPPSCHKPSYLTYKPILLTQKAFWFSETSPLSQMEIKLTNLRGYLKYRMCKNMQEKLFHDVIATSIQIKD